MIYRLFELIGREYFYEGRMYSSRYIEHVNTELIKPFYYHYYNVRDNEMRKVTYKVTIKNNGEEFYGFQSDILVK